MRTFLPWKIAGGVARGSGCVLLGYAFSAALITDRQNRIRIPLIPVTLLIAGAVAVHLRRRTLA